MDLFGQQTPAPSYPVPLTSYDRAAALQKKYDLKQAAFAARFQNISLAQFKIDPVRKAYIGQNVYIKPSSIVSIPEYHWFNSSTGELHTKKKNYDSDKAVKNRKNLANNQTNGQLSKKAIANIRTAINWMLVSTKRKTVYSHKSKSSFAFKVAFITLTLPDTTSRVTNSQFQKNLLNPFLVYLRKYNGLKNYVWKMEYQNNGKLHCHITIDTFVHWRDIRKRWNSLLDKHGFLDKFKAENGHSDPNSTDIHSIKKVKNLAAYLSKYMAKNKTVTGSYEGATYEYIPQMRGRIWSCNYELARAKTCKVHIPSDQCATELKTLFQPCIEYKDLQRENPLTKEVSKIGEIFYPRAINWINDITGIIKETFDKTVAEIQSAARHFTHFELTL